MESHRITILAIFLAWQACSCTCEVSTTWMQDALTQHFSKPRHHVTNPSYKQSAMIFIRDQFRDMGLEAHLDFFPTALSNVTGINVIGLLKGIHFNTPQDSVVAIGAHYDTMRDTPGVDDNGAAVVVMLQAAKELARQPHRTSSMLFIAFDFEEWETADQTLVACHELSCGSKSLVNQWLPNFFSKPLTWKGIFVMDTILNFDNNGNSQHFPSSFGQVFPTQVNTIKSDGTRGDFVMIAGRSQDQSLLQSFNATWFGLGQPQYQIEPFIVPAMTPDFEAFLRSDHASFWLEDLKAVFISDTANYRGYMVKCYHHPCDTIQRVTPAMMQFAAKMCRALISELDSMAPVSVTSASSRQLAGAPIFLSLMMAVLMFWQNQ